MNMNVDLTELEYTAGFDQLEDVDELAIEEVVNDGFMYKYTAAPSLAAFFEESPWTVEETEDLEAIDDEELDGFVAEHTEFETFEDLLRRAVIDWDAIQF